MPVRLPQLPSIPLNRNPPHLLLNSPPSPFLLLLLLFTIILLIIIIIIIIIPLSSLDPTQQWFSDSRTPDTCRFSGALVLAQLAIHAPPLVFARRTEILGSIWTIVSDRAPLVCTLLSSHFLPADLEPLNRTEKEKPGL